MKLPLSRITTTPGEEHFLSVKAFRKESTAMLVAGFEMARAEFAIDGNNYFTQSERKGEVKLKNENGKLIFENGNVKGVFNLDNGNLENYTVGGKRVFNWWFEPNFWRSPTDNDYGNSMPSQLGVWRVARQHLSLKSIEVKDRVIKCDYMLTDINSPMTIIYTIGADASVRVEMSADLSGGELPELPRFGMKAQLPRDMNNVKYYGRGEWENYSNRNHSTHMGIYSAKVKDLGWEYIRPQENGYRTDVRYVELTDGNGTGVRIDGVQPICFSARHNLDEDYDTGLTKKQMHTTDIYQRGIVALNIDLGQRGLGGDDSWWAKPHKEFVINPGELSYAFTVTPIFK